MKNLCLFILLAAGLSLAGCIKTVGPFVTNVTSDGNGGLIVEKGVIQLDGNGQFSIVDPTTSTIYVNSSGAARAPKEEAAPATEEKKSSMTLYTNDSENVSFRVPSDWDTSEINKKQEGSLIRTTVQTSEDKNGFKENVTFLVKKMDDAMTASEYLDETLLSLPKRLDSFKNEKTGKIKAGSANGRYLICTYKLPQYKSRVKSLIFLFTDGEKGYCLNCSSLSDDFDDYEDMFMTIGKSFQVNSSQ